MASNNIAGIGRGPLVRLWRFADCEVDELRRELRVRSTPVELEAKPFDVLIQLLHHASEVVTKEELLEAVWPGTSVVDGSLATAISKLRKAIGDEGQVTILTVARAGYRLAVPVQSKALTGAIGAELRLKVGDRVPGRDSWRLTRQMDFSGSSEVWLAENPRTHELRVFKFAVDGAQLRGLKREVTISRFLREYLGERTDFVRVLEWSFEQPPFFLESEYGGQNLVEWAQSEPGGVLSALPITVRLNLLADIARTVATAHELGVLHKDLKPSNLLIAPTTSGKWQVKVADFGSAFLAEPSRLGEFGITNLGFTQTANADNAITGTLTYLAPEILAGSSSTASADVYSLGVLLYQLVAGDFRKPLSPGWEADIEDPLLRQDIADAACGDPARRLHSAAELAERLDTLEARREVRNQAKLVEQRALLAERKLAETRARRPWVRLAIASMSLGLAVSLVLYRRAAVDRDNSRHQAKIVDSINGFLAGDLLGRSNPFKTGKADETLTEAIQRASPAIDRQFASEPLIAARLHQTIARALDQRTQYAASRQEYTQAAALFDRAEGPLSQNAVVVRLQCATLEARSYQDGSMAAAQSLLASQESIIGKLPRPRADLLVWLSTARGMVALISNDAKSAQSNFQSASEQAAKTPLIDATTRLAIKQRLAFSYIRLGNGSEAERLFRELIDTYAHASGPDSPEVLRVRLNLAQALMIENKFADAVDLANQIYPGLVSSLGPDHEITLQLLSTRAQCEGALGRWSDSIRDDLEVHRLAVTKQGPLSFFAIGTLSDAAMAQCRSGQIGVGASNARAAFDGSRKAFGEHAGLTGGVADTLVDCLIDQKHLDEASKLLATIEPQSVAQLVGVPDWAATLDLQRSDISVRRGDYGAAQKQIQPAIPVFTRTDAELYQKQRLEHILTEIRSHTAR